MFSRETPLKYAFATLQASWAFILIPILILFLFLILIL